MQSNFILVEEVGLTAATAYDTVGRGELGTVTLNLGIILNHLVFHQVRYSDTSRDSDVSSIFQSDRLVGDWKLWSAWGDRLSPLELHRSTARFSMRTTEQSIPSNLATKESNNTLYTCFSQNWRFLIHLIGSHTMWKLSLQVHLSVYCSETWVLEMEVKRRISPFKHACNLLLDYGGRVLHATP